MTYNLNKNILSK